MAVARGYAHPRLHARSFAARPIGSRPGAGGRHRASLGASRRASGGCSVCHPTEKEFVTFFCRRENDRFLVPEEGVEPTRPCGHRILSPARLPVPPLGHGDRISHGWSPTDITSLHSSPFRSKTLQLALHPQVPFERLRGAKRAP
jgi:hypothetical protein